MPASSQTRRLLEVTLAIGLWTALGLALHLNANAYLLVGIPLTVAFQWGVRGQPLRTLWVRDGTRFRLDVAGWVLVVPLAAFPCYTLIRNLRAGGNVTTSMWLIASTAGAFAAAYALRNFRRIMLRDLFFCLVTTGLIGVVGVGVVFLSGSFRSGAQHSLLARGHLFLISILQLVPVTFVIEEVSFRGAFDAHVFQPGEDRGLVMAVAVSVLWGLWHVPVVLGLAPLPILIPGLVVAHCALGVPLSIAWRRTGNLFVPGFVHALVDAVRNALMF